MWGIPLVRSHGARESLRSWSEYTDRERRRVLLFPRGNNVDHVSMYLEQGNEEDEKVPDGWYACVQFTLVMWNKNDPSIFKSQSKVPESCQARRGLILLIAANHRFNAEEADWGFTRFAEIRKMFNPSWEGKGRPMVENDAVNISAYLRIYKDPTGVLWHNFIKSVGHTREREQSDWTAVIIRRRKLAWWVSRTKALHVI